MEFVARPWPAPSPPHCRTRRPCARRARLRLDNALMESRIGLYETELIKPRKPWHGLADVQLATAEWVDWFYNQRLHTAIGDIPRHEHGDQAIRLTRAPTGGWRQRI
jgi:transposase InsO family protein